MDSVLVASTPLLGLEALGNLGDRSHATLSRVLAQLGDDCRTLLAEPTFQGAWKCRYQALRATALAQSTFDARIATWVAFTAAARARDQATWPTIGTPVFPNCTNQPSYDAEVTYLRTWISDRLAWLDAQAAAMPGACP